MTHEVRVGITTEGAMISRIKALRTVFHSIDPRTGVVVNSIGLKEAKELVEQMNRGGYATFMLNQNQIDILTRECFSILIGGGIYRKVYKQSTIYRENNGRKIEAIKDLRWCLDLGLKETKEMMDKMWSITGPVEYSLTMEQAEKLRMKGFTVTGMKQEHFEESLFEF